MIERHRHVTDRMRRSPTGSIASSLSSDMIPLPIPIDQIRQRKVLAGLISEYQHAA